MAVSFLLLSIIPSAPIIATPIRSPNTGCGNQANIARKGKTRLWAGTRQAEAEIDVSVSREVTHEGMKLSVPDRPSRDVLRTRRACAEMSRRRRHMTAAHSRRGNSSGHPEETFQGANVSGKERNALQGKTLTMKAALCSLSAVGKSTIVSRIWMRVFASM